VCLQRVAVCCSVLQCVAAESTALVQGHSDEGRQREEVLQRAAVCFAVRCSVLQCVADEYSALVKGHSNEGRSREDVS